MTNPADLPVEQAKPIRSDLGEIDLIGMFIELPPLLASVHLVDEQQAVHEDIPEPLLRELMCEV